MLLRVLPYRVTSLSIIMLVASLWPPPTWHAQQAVQYSVHRSFSFKVMNNDARRCTVQYHPRISGMGESLPPPTWQAWGLPGKFNDQTVSHISNDLRPGG